MPDISKEANAAVVDTDEMEEEGTTVLKAVDLDKKVEENEDEADMLKNQGMPMPNPNGMPMPGPNGRPMPGPNGRPMPGPNGMVPHSSQDQCRVSRVQHHRMGSHHFSQDQSLASQVLWVVCL